MKNKKILKLLLVILFVATGTYLYWLLYRKPTCGIDDANIFFIYMRNFVEGYGFVYNSGGERVEGFTSLLWTLMGSIVFLVSAHPEISLLLLNILLVSIALWQIILFADKLLDDNRLLSPFAFFLLGAVLLLPGYFDWTVLSLMETGLWSCILVTSVITLCRFELQDENHRRNNYLLSILLILLVMCRPESYLWGFAFLAIRFLQLRRLKHTLPEDSPFPNILLPLLCFIAAGFAITLWRLMYFGYPLPNTYYAKVSSDHIANFIEGARYDYHFFKDNFFLLLIFLPAAGYCINSALKGSWDKLKYCSAIIFTSIMVALAVPIYTGGDHFGQVRFMQPVVPLFYLIFFIMVMEYVSHYKIKTGYTTVAVSLLILVFSPAHSILDYSLTGGGIKQDFDIAENGRVAGNKLSDFFADHAPLPSVGFLTLGGLPYVYKGRSIDLFGLNNVAVAHASRVKTGVKNHASFDKKMFYKLAPDIFFVASFVPDTNRSVIEEKKPNRNHVFYQSVYKGIFDDKEFRSNYLFVFIFRKNEKNFLLTYANKNFLGQLDTTYYSWQTIPGTP